MKIRLFGTADDSIVDGPGIRFSVFTQGCKHNCPGCHNPGSHDLNGGYEDTTENLLKKIKSNPLLDGVTFSGGEPFLQAKPLAEIAREAHNLGLNVFTYSGFTFEQLVKGADSENGWMELLSETDTLVDGKFEIEKRHYSLVFRGSSNQRIIDVKKTFETGNIITVEY